MSPKIGVILRVPPAPVASWRIANTCGAVERRCAVPKVDAGITVLDEPLVELVVARAEVHGCGLVLLVAANDHGSVEHVVARKKSKRSRVHRRKVGVGARSADTRDAARTIHRRSNSWRNQIGEWIAKRPKLLNGIHKGSRANYHL